MATKEMRVCDVTGSTKDVRRIGLKMIDLNDPEGETSPIASWVKDLTPKSIERWKKFIERGCTPPAPRATKGKAK